MIDTATPPPSPPALRADDRPAAAPSRRRARAPAPSGETIAKPADSPTQVAAIDASRASEGVLAARVDFAAGHSELTEDAKTALRGKATELKRDENSRIQALAYATGSTASEARRISLARALAVRAFLAEQGIASRRIDVRALGDRAEGGPADRVDLLVVGR